METPVLEDTIDELLLWKSESSYVELGKPKGSTRLSMLSYEELGNSTRLTVMAVKSWEYLKVQLVWPSW